MTARMKTVWTVLIATLVVIFIVSLFLLVEPLGTSPEALESAAPANNSSPVLRIGLIPERDVFRQRKRYRVLMDYVSQQLGQPTELVMASSYEGILQDFAEERIEGAFLGSLVAVLAMDRHGAKVVLKPELQGKVSTYHGVIFVRDDSPIKKLEDLSGRSIAMVRTTTGGNLFPCCVLMRMELWGGPNRPQIVWMGTHDDVALKVMEGEVDAGAIKNLRLDAFMRSHPEMTIRRLAEGQSVPSNALLLRSDVDLTLGDRLSEIMLTMGGSDEGRKALDAMGVAGFVPCQPKEYMAVYEMVECVEEIWEGIGISGPPPKRPSDWPQRSKDDPPRCYDVSY